MRALGAVAALRGELEWAVRLAVAGQTHHEAGGIRLGGHAEGAWFERHLAPAYRAIAELARSAAEAAGRALSLELALAEATGIHSAP